MHRQPVGAKPAMSAHLLASSTWRPRNTARWSSRWSATSTAVRAPRGSRAALQGLAPGGGAADALQQPRPRGGRGPERTSSSTADRGARRAATRRCAAIVASLLDLEDDETLLVQSGKPVAVFRTHAGAPRVLIANSLLVPRFATWDEFRRLEAEGLTMFGQMTAGSWIYIGTQGILQGTFQTFAAAGEAHWGSPDLAGRTILTAGLGGMGGAQPLAASLAGAVSLNVEIDPHRIERRLETRYLDEVADDLDDALRRVRRAADAAPGCLHRPAGQRRRRLPRARPPRGAFRPRHRPDVGARHAERLRAARHDLRRGARAARGRRRRLRAPGAGHGGRPRRGDGRLQGRRLRMSSTTATTCAPRRRTRATSAPSTSPASCPRTSARCSAGAPARSAGRRSPATRRTSPASTGRCSRRSPTTRLLQRWLAIAPERIAFQGLPSRICWLGQGDRAKAGLLFNDLVRRGEVSAPIVIGRDHLDTGSVASPFRETEAMKDGSDAIADWPILNALLSTASGASLGLGAPRRRRRHRQLDPRRHGDRRRRHRRRWTSGWSGC